MYLNFCFCFFDCCSCTNYEFSNRIKNFVIAARIKKYKSIIKKKKKKNHDKIVLLAKSGLNIIEVLISIALINSVINQNDFVLIKNMRKEYDDMKEKIKTSNNK